MKPTDTLRHEHDIILLVLEAAEREANSASPDVDKVEQMLDFFRNFADKCHHMKEENQLFVRLAERGMPVEGGPIAVMLSEHEMGRQYLRDTTAAITQVRAGNAGGVESIQQNLGGYVELLRSHIAKENNILFPMADRFLAPDDQADLEREFERVEAEEIGEGVHEKYHHLAHELVG
jgi:hemerythrin-like domain-containing protein